MGRSPRGHKKLDMTERLTHTHTRVFKRSWFLKKETRIISHVVLLAVGRQVKQKHYRVKHLFQFETSCHFFAELQCSVMD